MAARKLAQGCDQSQRKRGPGRPFQKGQCPNPGGLTAEQRAAADAARGLALSHAQEVLPDGRTRARAILDTLCTLGLEGNVPACTAYLDRTGYKPVERVEHSGDLELAIRRRVYDPDADGNG